jgi:YbgC/YbaW family acyl-CoA thioester hydrolase
MFRYSTSIRLRDTDATGVLFFTEQLRLALETFEEYLRSKKYSLAALLESCDCLMPIIHAEADYSVPLLLGDEIEIAIELGGMGSSSFTLSYKFFKGGGQIRAGSASIVHVAVSKITREKIPLPEELISFLQEMPQGRAVVSDRA